MRMSKNITLKKLQKTELNGIEVLLINKLQNVRKHK